MGNDELKMRETLSVLNLLLSVVVEMNSYFGNGNFISFTKMRGCFEVGPVCCLPSKASVSSLKYPSICRIGEVEARRNCFLVERENKLTLFQKGASPSVSRNASRTVSLDETNSLSDNSLSSSSNISPVHSPRTYHRPSEFTYRLFTDI